MKVYISGPMSGIKDLNFPAFNRLEECIKNIDNAIEVINPVKISDLVDKFIVNPQYLDYLKADLKKLLDCDCVICLDGWESSKGAQIETQLAEKMNIKICFGFDDFLEWYQIQLKQNFLNCDDNSKLYIIKNEKGNYVTDFGWSIHRNKAKIFQKKSTAEGYGKMLAINQDVKKQNFFKKLFLVEVDLFEKEF